MFGKLLQPKLSKRERAIINECCRQVSESMKKADDQNTLDPEIKQIHQEIQIIMKKLEPTT
jgi:hypothetical protein